MQHLFVDDTNKLILAANMDKGVRAYDLQSKHPVAKYVGHDEVVRGIDYLPEKGLYVTGMRQCSLPVKIVFWKSLCASVQGC